MLTRLFSWWQTSAKHVPAGQVTPGEPSQDSSQCCIDRHPACYYRRFVEVLGACLVTAIVVIYIATPPALDQQTSIAAAQQADFHGAFPHNVVEAWNMRGLGYKLAVYGLYKGATTIANYRDKTYFELAFNSLAAMVLMVILGMSVVLARPVLGKYGIHSAEAFLVGCVSFFTLSSWCAFQPEDFAAWTMVLGVACSLGKHRTLHVAGGLVLACTIAFKGVTAVFGGMGLLAIALLEPHDKRRLWTVGAAYVLGTVAIVSIVAIWAPTEISDLRMAATFQQPLKIALGVRIKDLVAALLLMGLSEFPVFLGGTVAGLICFGYLLRKREARSVAIYCSAWLLASCGPMIQSKHFAYHYLPFVPLAAGSIVAVLALSHATKTWTRLAPALWIVPGVACLIIRLTTVNVPLGRFSAHNITVFAQREERIVKKQYAKAMSLFHLENQPAVLYLGGGGKFAYYFMAKSYLRYFSRASARLSANHSFKNRRAPLQGHTGKSVSVSWRICHTQAHLASLGASRNSTIAREDQSRICCCV